MFFPIEPLSSLLELHIDIHATVGCYLAPSPRVAGMACFHILWPRPKTTKRYRCYLTISIFGRRVWPVIVLPNTAASSPICISCDMIWTFGGVKDFYQQIGLRFILDLTPFVLCVDSNREDDPLRPHHLGFTNHFLTGKTTNYQKKVLFTLSTMPTVT